MHFLLFNKTIMKLPRLVIVAGMRVWKTMAPQLSLTISGKSKGAIL